MKPKVSVIITRADIGGAQNYALWMMEGLHNIYEFQLIVGTKGYLTNELENLGINYHLIPELDSKNIYSAVAKLRHQIQSDMPDIINIHSTLAAFYTRLACIGNCIPIIYSVHGWFFANNTSWNRQKFGPLLESCLSGFTSHWITETQYDLDLGIKTKAIPNRASATVIPNGAPAPTNSRHIELDRSKVQLVFIGRNSYQKNPELALKVLSNLPERYVLTIYCGNVSVDNLELLMTELGLSKRAKIIQGENDTGALVHNYDIVLCTSRYEGMPLAIIQAMASSVPIVVPNTCGLSELILNGKNGVVVDSYEPTAFSEAISNITKNSMSATSMGIFARQIYESRHTIDNTASLISQVFNKHL